MAETEQNFTMAAGDAKVVRIVIPTDQEAGGLVGYWRLARSLRPNGVTELDKKTGGAGIVITEAVVEGVTSLVVSVTLAKEDTEELDGLFYHQARLILPSGEPVMVATGRVTIDPAFVPNIP